MTKFLFHIQNSCFCIIWISLDQFYQSLVTSSVFDLLQGFPTLCLTRVFNQIKILHCELSIFHVVWICSSLVLFKSKSEHQCRHRITCSKKQLCPSFLKLGPPVMRPLSQMSNFDPTLQNVVCPSVKNKHIILQSWSIRSPPE